MDVPDGPAPEVVGSGVQAVLTGVIPPAVTR